MNSGTVIYADHNATTPPAPQAVAAMLECCTAAWGNASSMHAIGQEAKQRLGAARAALAKVLDCKPAGLVFTSGATEANHMALHAAPRLTGRTRLLVSAVEHAGILALTRHLAGVQVDRLPVTSDGALDLDAAADLMADDVALVSVMAANNETGVLMPVAQLAELARARGALLHVDATQLVGKLPFSFAASGADLATVSAHKLHGPKGVGALLVRPGLALPALTAGSQERGRRGGTENLPAIAGFAAAAALLPDADALAARAARLASLRDGLERDLGARLPGTHVYGAAGPRLPNTSYLRFGLHHADQVLNRLERAGVIASSGSACASGGFEPSHVLTAMGVPRPEALCAVRLSLSMDADRAVVDALRDAVVAALAPLMQGAPSSEPDFRQPLEPA